MQRGELVSKKARSDGAETKTCLLTSASTLLHCASPPEKTGGGHLQGGQQNPSTVISWLNRQFPSSRRENCASPPRPAIGSLLHHPTCPISLSPSELDRAMSFPLPPSLPQLLNQACASVCMHMPDCVCVCVCVWIGKKFRRKMGSHEGEASMKGHHPFL